MVSLARALVVLGCAIAVASCAGGGAKRSAVPEAAAMAPEPMLAADPRQQIRDLDDEIASARTQLALEDPGDDPLPGVPAQPMGAESYSANPSCRPAPSETCKSSCTLSDSICGNADKICRIAQDLVGDTWAQGKCAKANQTCESSRTKCCGCV
jgi:hypothetical protein